MSTAKFIEKEQDWQNEATRYWFDLDGQEFCVVESGPHSEVLDQDGKEIADRVEAMRLATLLVVTDEIRAL